MSQAATRPWWADVEHLREPTERRRRASESASRPPERAQRAERPHAQPPARRGGAAADRPRRTVVIRGQAIPSVSAPRLVEVERRRPPRLAAERLPARPDRLALWAVMLGMLLVTVATLSGHA